MENKTWNEKEAVLSGKVRQVVNGEEGDKSHVDQNPWSELNEGFWNFELIYFSISISTGTLFDCHWPLVVFAIDI